MSPIWKKQIFGSVVKDRIRQVVVMVMFMVRVSLMEMNVSLYSVPKSDLGQHICVCVCVLVCVKSYKDKCILHLMSVGQREPG